MAEKKQCERQDSQHAGGPEAGRFQLDPDSQNPADQQQEGHHRRRQEADQIFRPRRPDLRFDGGGQVVVFINGPPIFGDRPHSRVGDLPVRHGQQFSFGDIRHGRRLDRLPLGAEPFDLSLGEKELPAVGEDLEHFEVFVHHGHRQIGRVAVLLRPGAELLAERGDILLFHGLGTFGRGGDGRGRADHGARGHEKPLAGERQVGAGRPRAAGHALRGHRPHVGGGRDGSELHHLFPDPQHVIDAPARRIELEDHERRFFGLDAARGAVHERDVARVQLSRDGNDEDVRVRGLRGRGRQDEQKKGASRKVLHFYIIVHVAVFDHHQTGRARRFEVRVVPRSKRRGVEPGPEGSLVVRVEPPPEDGRANRAVVEVLADHFGVPKRAVVIVRGETSRRKLVEIRLQAGR
ncbi:MAG: DUF167 domain-containing protein [Planctomycetes bacterium]|nr:DUF167 domain-containing protein [Planctomycetota bacterium]